MMNVTTKPQELLSDASQSSAAFDPHRVRAMFPILSQEVYGKPLVYLDNAASAQKPEPVISAMRSVMEHDYANVHRGLHYLSNRATDLFEQARESARQFLGAPSLDTVIFTGGATDAINLVADSFLAPQIQPGDEIILSVMEHHSNIVPWHFLRERYGAELKWIGLDADGRFDEAAFNAALSARTKMVAITHMSNVLGVAPPIANVIAAAHERDIPVLVDGCQGAVHLDIDVAAMDCDFYVMSGHKTYGPTGIGVLYAKPEHLQNMRPYRGGGEMIHEVYEDHISYAAAPHKFEAGTPAIIEAIGLGAAFDFMANFDRHAVQDHEHALVRRAEAQLADMPQVTVWGAQAPRAILSFSVEGVHPHDIATIIDRSGIAIRAGHHCAQPLMRRLGVPATARASFAMYNTEEEVDLFVAALGRAIALFT